MLKRLLDLTIALPLLVVFAPLMLLVAIAVRATSRGPAIYWSQRVGRGNVLFAMPKFRSMRTDTPAVATHLLSDSRRWITPIGAFLRKTSLDELPQLWCVVMGSMSLVGPRPALFNQDDLIAARTSVAVHQLQPGITGWAQVNGRDELSISAKVAFDEYYLHQASVAFDLYILALTAVRVLRRDGIRQADDGKNSAKPRLAA